MVRWNTQRKVETRDRETMPEISQQKIAKRAYERFMARGGRHGEDWRDWFEAERELKAEAHRN